MNKTEGKKHPVSLIIEEMVAIFSDLGFEVVLGPEMEDEYHNFDALNVPKDHPARDMQDTFWIKNNPGKLMRTHTSPVQIRYMEAYKPPFAIVVPGKVFRNEATDATHEAQFHQIEGLVVAPNLSMAHLKGVLLEFFRRFVGPETDIRLRPSFFPFVEPGIEVDVKMTLKNGETAWVEVLGAGMVHPKVLSGSGVNPEEFSGFAFGMGIDRLIMLKLGVTDVRYLYQGDLRLNQF